MGFLVFHWFRSVERIRVQPRLLEVLRDLPAYTGVEVRRDVVGIEEFYTLLSGEDVELNGFVDLSAMLATVGFKLRARNMTALGVQVLGTVLNKTVSTGWRRSMWFTLGRASSQSPGLWNRRYSVWIYLLFCSGGNHLERFVPWTRYSMQDSEDRAAWSCLMDTGVDPEGSGRSGAAPECWQEIQF